MSGDKIKFSGVKVHFESGATREIKGKDKGRCDLLPLKAVAKVLQEKDKDEVLKDIGEFVETGNIDYIASAIRKFTKTHTKKTDCEMIIEVSKQYQQGAEKHGERNWEKGFPVHSFIDSGVRHFLLHIDGKVDEPHDRAFMWNMLGCMWTMENRPECIDINFRKSK
ncbi:MAG: DUF5664 domain-containing protein [Firmicutes bacterium]|nr:DUF5664 domain-containing protein [Bacillota bacterium]